jgi:hypothetical protein
VANTLYSPPKEIYKKKRQHQATGKNITELEELVFIISVASGSFENPF